MLIWEVSHRRSGNWVSGWGCWGRDGEQGEVRRVWILCACGTSKWSHLGKMVDMWREARAGLQMESPAHATGLKPYVWVRSPWNRNQV